MRLNAIKINKIVKRHEKTRLKSSFVAGPFSTRKHEENVMFQCSSNQICRMLEKARAKSEKPQFSSEPSKRKCRFLEKTRANWSPTLLPLPNYAKSSRHPSKTKPIIQVATEQPASQPSHSQAASQQSEKTRKHVQYN